MDKSIIICEGKTDAIFLSYYLEAIQGWQSVKVMDKVYRKECEKSIKNGTEFKIKDNATQEVNWYINKNELLCIRAAGGVDLISDTFKEVLEVNYNNYDEYFKKIAILADRDDEVAEKKLLNELSNCFNKEGITISHNYWNEIKYFKNSFGENRSFKLFTLLIPQEKEGAMETFLLNALSDKDRTDKKVIEQCNHFIENLDSNIEELKKQKYLIERGERLKAKFATFFAIASPRRVFDSGDKILKSVKWEEFSYVNENFKIMVDGLK